MINNDTIDPLALLKDALMRGEKITDDKEMRQLFFEGSNLRLSYDTKTAWKRTDKSNALYTLIELYLVMVMKSEKFGKYAGESNKRNVKPVEYKDRSALLQYFTSKEESMPASVDMNVWSTTLIRRDGQPIRKRDEKVVRKDKDNLQTA